MKIAHKIAGVVASVAIVLIVLSTAFDLAVYGDYGYFEKEYVKYEIQNQLPMEMDDIMEVTEHMMEYLRGREEDMQIRTVVDGQEREFFNEQDLFHMAEVRELFLGMYRLRLWGLAALALAVIAMVAARTRFSSFFRMYQVTRAGFAVLIVVLGSLIAINFDRVFIIFHHIMFDNSAWLFDPATDLMINMLPEGLFMDFAVRILVCFALLLAAVEGGMALTKRWLAKREGRKKTGDPASGTGAGKRAAGSVRALTALLVFSLGIVAFQGTGQAAENAVIPVQSSMLSLPDWPEGPEVESDAAILIDARTGNILYAKNMDEQYYPASITKVLTALIACEQGDMNDIITYSHNAIYSIPWDGSTVGFSEGEKVSLLDSLYGMMLASGNEAAVGIAEYIAGSEEAFADRMNERAAEAGALRSHFVTSNGLHDDDHYTTAYDMAMIFRAALQNDLFLQIASTYSYDIAPTNMEEDGYRVTSGHRMLNTRSEYYYPYAVAGKTGYTSNAGNTLVTYAKQGDTELICVILHSYQTQYPDTEALLEYGFSSYTCYNAAKEDTAYGGDSLSFFSFLSSDFQDSPVTVHMEDTYLLVPETAAFSDITSYMEYQEGDTQSNILGYVHYEYEGIEVGVAAVTLESNVMEKPDAGEDLQEPDADGTQAEGETEPQPSEETESGTKKIVLINVWHILGGILLGIAALVLLLFLVYYFSPKQRRYRRRRKMRRTYGSRGSRGRGKRR